MASSSNPLTAPRDLSTAILIRVDQSGKRDFRKIQDAINSVPSHSNELYFIWVKPGIYKALRVSADLAAFYGCRIQSYQDTLLDDTGRHYFKNCYVEGAIDFICGNATSLFEKYHLHSVANGFTGTQTAQKTEKQSQRTVPLCLLACKITGTGSVFLGEHIPTCRKSLRPRDGITGMNQVKKELSNMESTSATDRGRKGWHGVSAILD